MVNTFYSTGNMIEQNVIFTNVQVCYVVQRIIFLCLSGHIKHWCRIYFLTVIGGKTELFFFFTAYHL